MKRLYIDLAATLAVALLLSKPASGQNDQSAPGAGLVIGTVTDVNGDAISGATVVLKEVAGDDPRVNFTNENGMFEFQDVNPGIPYQLSISAKNFENLTSEDG
jgi:hypothetical protein